ncbi:MAG: putative lipid II flippase FtsW [bacterium]|nr:putative lipid II flippase FtsW [bacterium]
MAKSKHLTDYTLLLAVFGLVSIGIVMVYSASYVKAMSNFGDSNVFLVKHIIRVITGLILMAITFQIDYRHYQKFSKLFLLIAGALLIYTLMVGVAIKGSARWLNIAGFSVQPSEIAKYALIFYMADNITRKQERLAAFFDGFFPMLAVTIVFALLVLMAPDFSSAFVILSIIFMMFFIGDVKIIHLAGTFLAAIPVLVLAIIYEPYRLKRFLAYLKPDADPLGAGYHIRQSLISLGSGGLFGVGLGMSKEKLLYLPEPFTDFIFAILGEELGFIGASLVLGSFLVILWRGLLIAKDSKDLYGKLLASGITLSIVFAAMVNIGVVCGLLPTTGLTIPFISYGGTSLVLTLAATGVLLNIARQNQETESTKRK